MKVMIAADREGSEHHRAEGVLNTFRGTKVSLTGGFFSRLSLQVKLVAIMLWAVAVTLFLAGLSQIAYEMYVFRERVLTTTNVTAEIVGQGSVTALASSDRHAAITNLRTLQGDPRIAAAILYDTDGEILASYWRADAAPGGQVVNLKDFPLQGDYVDAIQEIRLEGRVIGQLHLRRDLRDRKEKLREQAMIIGAVSLVCLLASILLSFTLQRVISKPILLLAGTAKLVREKRDYSLRVELHAEDELGYLARRFNQMMDGIQRRDMELKLIQGDLERRVDARTADLRKEVEARKKAQEHLLKAKQAAERSNRAKDIFLANMSHELRTPLNAVIGYSEMLEEEATEMGEEQRAKDLGKVRAAGRHLLALVNDVLDLSQIEAGHLELRLGDFRIGSLWDEVASTGALLARQHGNRFEATCEDSDMTVEIDPVKFRQCLYNLLSNACRFTENGVVRLGVGKTTLAGREWVEWSVSDSGIGIAPEHMNKLFKPFSQVDNSPTRKYGGTGLGLAISRRLCEMMGGTIVVRSSPGTGSTFIIQLPARVADTRAESAVIVSSDAVPA